jgi:hypothetical protein
MSTYRVTLEIDVDGDTPQEAAHEAALLFDGYLYDSYYEVQETDRYGKDIGPIVGVDLPEERDKQ